MRTRDARIGSIARAALVLCVALPVASGALWAKPKEPKQPKEPKAPKLDLAGEARQQAAALPSEPYWPYRLAELQLAKDSLAAAERSLEAALARDARYVPALSLLSSLHYRKGRHEESIRLLEAARAGAGEGGLPAALLAGLALHYEAAGKPAEARATLGALGRPGRESRSAAVFLTLRGSAPDSADSWASAEWRDRPKSAASQNNYGITRLRAGDLEAARRAFETAIALDTALPGPYYNLAILEKFYLQDHAAAARWFQQYLRRSQEDPDGLAQVLSPGLKENVAEQKGGSSP